MAERTKVIIVGGGPVGVGLGIELGMRGVRCTVVERRTELQHIPKGQGLSQRTLEHFYFWGIEQQLRAARVLPKGYPIEGVTAYKDLMSDYWYQPPGRGSIRPFYYVANERLPQYETEKVLRAKVATLPNVRVLMGRTARSVEQDADGVRVTVESMEWPYGEEVLEGDYVVGCDGAHSLIREKTGIKRRGADFDQKMALVVFRSSAFHEALERFPHSTTYRAMDPALQGYWMFFGRVDVGQEFFFHAPVPLDAQADTYDFQSLLNRAAGFEFEAEFLHKGFWDLKVAVANEYQKGRVIIAGDAAHSHPPYGGFGLNNGLEDVANLGWKLTAVLEGWGTQALLDSYGEERRPIFWETGQDFIAHWIEKDRDFLNTYSPEKDEPEFARQWKAQGETSHLAVYEPHYEGSSVLWGPEGGECSAHGSHTLTARAGHHLPPATLSDGRGVHEAFGPWFTLLALDATDSEVAAFEQAAQAEGVPLTVVRDAVKGGREGYEARLILVRPDQYVAWLGDAAPADAAAVLRRTVGR
jgi:2-polyprenyl-6-methoxyphenol hydroxylase-like FAD-dependent oxidoreductase